MEVKMQVPKNYLALIIVRYQNFMIYTNHTYNIKKPCSSEYV